MTNTFTRSDTFTVTHARYIASKVAADLRRVCGYYGRPSETEIKTYHDELVELLAGGYLACVEYGFKKGEERVITLLYEVKSNGILTDSSAGGVYARADVSGASWYSFLEHSSAWLALSDSDRAKFVTTKLRSTGEAPKDGSGGYWAVDRSYSAGGVLAERRIFRPY